MKNATKPLRHNLSRRSGKVSQRFKYKHNRLSEAFVSLCLCGRGGLFEVASMVLIKLTIYINYFPIQKFLKICPSISSVDIMPVISPR